jgi:hypothetical protein
MDFYETTAPILKEAARGLFVLSSSSRVSSGR